MTLRVQMNCRVRRDILELVRDKLHSPLYQRTIHGSMSTLIENLLIDWLKANATQPERKEPSHD